MKLWNSLPPVQTRQIFVSEHHSCLMYISLRRSPYIDAPPALPCQLEQIRQLPHHPSNIYGEHYNPVQQIREIKQETIWKDLTSQSAPSMSETPTVPDAMPSSPTFSKDNIEYIVWKGGDAMVLYLCIKAVSLSKEVNKPNYCKWSYRDLLCLPESECKQWFKVCKVEFHMLK